MLERNLGGKPSNVSVNPGGYPSVLLQFDGELTDVYGHTVAGIGTLTYSSSPYGQAVQLGTAGSYIRVSQSSDLLLTGDFTAEFFLIGTGASTSNSGIFGRYANSANQYPSYQVYGNSIYAYPVTSTHYNSSIGIPYGNNVRTHVALTRQGNVWNTFIGGTLCSTVTVAYTPQPTGQTDPFLVLGNLTTFNNALTALKLDAFRFINGLSLYSATFSPPDSFAS